MQSTGQSLEPIWVRNLPWVPVLADPDCNLLLQKYFGAGRPTIPFDLLYRFPAWENQAPAISPPQNLELSDQLIHCRPPSNHSEPQHHNAAGYSAAQREVDSFWGSIFLSR